MSKIEPRTLKGFRDFLPEEEARRQKMLETIRNVFERFGFLPLSTPALEYYDILAGKYGEEGERLMYRFQDRGGREVAMRYDLTVPLARVVAQYGDKLVRPFKRYQIAPVWRGENPQKGRFREFFQCDVDVVGSSSVFADAEVVAAIYEAIAALGVRDARAVYNNRTWLFSNLQQAGVQSDMLLDAARILDKADKMEEAKLKEELSEKNLPRDLLQNVSRSSKPNEAEAFEEALGGLGVQNQNMEFRPTLARGLDYYTGLIFEIVLGDETIGSVAGGGRYDNLIGMFTGNNIPAVGGSIGIDRLFAVVSAQEAQGTIPSVLVMHVSENLGDAYLAIASALRKEGIDADLYYEPADLDKQFRYGEKKGMRVAVMYGENEKQQGTVTIKDLAKREQKTVPMNALASEIKKLLNA